MNVLGLWHHYSSFQWNLATLQNHGMPLVNTCCQILFYFVLGENRGQKLYLYSYHAGYKAASEMSQQRKENPVFMIP